MYTNLGQLVMKGHCSPEVSNTLPPQPGFHAGENVIVTIAYMWGDFNLLRGLHGPHFRGSQNSSPGRTFFSIHADVSSAASLSHTCFFLATFGGARRNAVEGVIPTQYGCDY